MKLRATILRCRLLMLGATASFLACDDTGPSPIGDHAPDEISKESMDAVARAENARLELLRAAHLEPQMLGFNGFPTAI